MSDRTEKKLKDVVVGRFHYRHEAEFAAGFLDDAEIPYRLQVDDAAMGMTIATPATLWVRGMDVQRAREVLDLPELDSRVPASVPAEAAWRSELTPVRASPPQTETGLTPIERVVALVIAAGSVGAASLIANRPLASALLVVGIAFTVSGVVGRTISPIKGFLRAISGSAP